MFKVHKEPVRSILWKERWADTDKNIYELFSCSDVNVGIFLGWNCQIGKVGLRKSDPYYYYM